MNGNPQGENSKSPAVMWEERYGANPDEWFFGREPSALGRLAAHYWKVCYGDTPARALELGCGEGRDAVYFAQRGHIVTAVEIASSGVAKTERLARDCGVELAAVHCKDIREWEFKGDHNLIFAGNSLNAFGLECLSYLRQIREATPSGGINAIRATTREAWGVDERPEVFRFDRNELKYEYRGWRLLYYGEDLLYVQHMDRLASFADIIAQKI